MAQSRHQIIGERHKRTHSRPPQGAVWRPHGEHPATQWNEGVRIQIGAVSGDDSSVVEITDVAQPLAL